MPCRIAYITDTHIGGDASVGRRQPARPDLLSELHERLAAKLRDADVDLLVHGGDVTHHGSAAEQDLAAEMLNRLPVPSVIVLGNHDLIDRGAFSRWTRDYVSFLPGGRGDFVLGCGPVDLVVLTNQYRGPGQPLSYHWDHESQNDEGLTAQQLTWLDQKLAQESERPAVVAVHCPLTGIGPELTGEADGEEKDAVAEAYAKPLADVLQRHSRVRLLLTGHTHVNYARRVAGVRQLMSAAFVEVPFCWRLVTVDGHDVRVETLELATASERELLDENARWALGRDADRSLGTGRTSP